MIDFGFGVSLGSIEEEYLHSMREARNDYSTWKWCRQPSLVPLQSHKSWFDWQAKDPNTKMFAIHSKDLNNCFVGVCGLTTIDWVNRRAEFSLYIIPHNRQRGYAKAALQTLFSHGFADLNLNLIWGETFEGNPAFEMFKSIGMKHEGTRRDFYFKDGKYLGANLVSVRGDEWITPKCRS